jgi:hypothetical protein
MSCVAFNAAGSGKPALLMIDFAACNACPIEREYTADKIDDERVEFGIRYGAIDPTVTLRSIGVEIVRTHHNLKSARSPNKKRQPLKRSTSRYQARADFRLSENRFLTTSEANIASQSEFTSAATNSSPDDGNAQHAAPGQPRRGIDPWRYAETAARPGRTVMSNEKIGIRTFERHVLERRVRLDLSTRS